MKPDCLQFRLTEEERAQFERLGYLAVPNALPADRCAALEEIVDRMDADARANGLGPHERFFYPNFLGRDQAFVDILDWPRVIPKVWGLLGWNIYSYHTHLIVTPPLSPEEQTQPKRLGWHQDSGRVNVEMESHPRPRLSLKVGYFLSDCSEPGRGNFAIVPGSHLQDTFDFPEDGVSDPPDAIAVCGNVGDAVLFDRRLWHAAGRNHSDITRKMVFYGYGYRWLRPKDDMTIPDEIMEAADPIRKQLLGWSPGNNARFSPKEGEAPLREWLAEHDPDTEL